MVYRITRDNTDNNKGSGNFKLNHDPGANFKSDSKVFSPSRQKRKKKKRTDQVGVEPGKSGGEVSAFHHAANTTAYLPHCEMPPPSRVIYQLNALELSLFTKMSRLAAQIPFPPVLNTRSPFPRFPIVSVELCEGKLVTLRAGVEPPPNPPYYPASRHGSTELP